MRMNKKGLWGQIWTIIIIMIVIVIIVGGFFVYSLVSPVFTGTSSLIRNTLISGVNSTGNENLTMAVTITADSVNNSMQVLNWLGYMLLITMMVGVVMVAYYVRTYPFLIIYWLVFIILLVFISMLLSNAYESYANTGGFVSDNMLTNTANYYIMIYLPYIVSMFGVLVGIILFVLAGKEPETENTIL